MDPSYRRETRRLKRKAREQANAAIFKGGKLRFPQGKPRYGNLYNYRELHCLNRKIDTKDPFRPKGIVNMNADFTVCTGKKAPAKKDALDFCFTAEAEHAHRLYVGPDRKLHLTATSNFRTAYWRNLSFINCGSKQSHKCFRYIAYTITKYGCTRRILLRLRYAATLAYRGAGRHSLKVVKAVASSCFHWRRRHTAPTVFKDGTSHFSYIGSYSDSDSDWD